MVKDVTGGGKFMGTGGVKWIECKWRIVKNHEEDAQKFYKWKVTPLVSGVRGRQGILTEGKQGRSLFKKARNTEALKMGDKSARSDGYFGRDW